MKDYSFYIFSAYGFAAVVVGFLAVKITLDYRALKRALDRFERRENGR
jgi:heme exporter protein CcmD